MNDSAERIIQAATDLFLQSSFHQVGTAQICSAAGVNKGTLYHFFPTKVELLLAVLERYTSDVARQYEAAQSRPGTPAERLRSLFEVPKTNNEQRKQRKGHCSGCGIGNIVSELSSSEPAVRDKAQWALSTLTAVFEKPVAALLDERGYAHADTHHAATMLMGMFQGAQVMAKLNNDPGVFDDFAAISDSVVCAAARQSAQQAASANLMGASARL